MTTRASVPGTASPAPAHVLERHGAVDGLRGVALLGIAVVNAQFVLEHSDVGWAGQTSGIDLAVRWAVMTFGELKVYPLFALLFGYGLTVQIDRAATRGSRLGARYGRRMLALVVLGVAHAVLFFPGDVLVVYGCVGAVLYLLRRRGSAALLWVAGAVYALASATWLVIGAELLATGEPLTAAPSAGALEVLAAGGFEDVVGEHLGGWPATLALLAAVQGPAAFAFALVGVVLGRTAVLARPDAHRRRAWRVLAIAGPVGTVVGGVGGFQALQGAGAEAMGLAVGFLAAPAIAAAYVAAFVLAWDHLPALVSRLLRAGGRMSLSVYLLESVVLSTLSYGYGAGLFSRLSPLGTVLLAVGVWLGLSLLALGWWRSFRFGPVEWALRTVSYWRLQPLLISGRS